MSGVADPAKPSLGYELPKASRDHSNHGQEERIMKGIDELFRGARSVIFCFVR